MLFGQAENSISSAFDPTIGDNGGFVGGNLEQTRAAFGFDGELGLRWHQAISDDMDWNVEVGYQGTTYLNALQDSPFNLLDPTGFTTNDGSQNNYYNYGPYLTIGLAFF